MTATMAERAAFHRDTHEIDPRDLGFDFYCVAHGADHEIRPNVLCHESDADGYCVDECPDCSQRCPWCARKGWQEG